MGRNMGYVGWVGGGREPWKIKQKVMNEKKKEINVETPEDEDLVKTNFLKINFKKMCHLNVLF